VDVRVQVRKSGEIRREDSFSPLFCAPAGGTMGDGRPKEGIDAINYFELRIVLFFILFL
jgi:hypothetical protein